jgi:predicted transposase/invertase (TIGR01784 family)
MAAELVEKLDFSRIQHLPTSFIPDNLRKQEADVLFLIPFVGEPNREVLIYILIEHQSSPSPSMGFRLTFYMFQIWDKQRREWVEKKVPEEQWRFRPILPIVFYTGSEKWETPLTISALMDLPPELEPYQPHHQVLFLPLKGVAPQDLTQSGHPFGWVLRVIQKEEASREELTEALMRAMEYLESLSSDEAGMWEKLVYYLVLLIYHRRDPSEHEMLLEQMKGRIRAHFHQEEVANMRQTAAQALIQEGRELGVIENQRENLVTLLQAKFGQLPSTTVQRIQSLRERERLDTLFRQAIVATRLEEMKIE